MTRFALKKTHIGTIEKGLRVGKMEWECRDCRILLVQFQVENYE
jgi:hypothetical protein